MKNTNKPYTYNSEGKNIFYFDYQSKEKITEEECDLILTTILKLPSGKKGLIECAKKHKTDFPLFMRLLADKKSIDDNRVFNVFRSVLCDNNRNNTVTLFCHVVKFFIDSENHSENIISNRDKFTHDALRLETAEYKSAIEILTKDIDIVNVIWFLKITGNEPNNKQIEIINEIEKQYQNEEKTQKLIHEITNAAIEPISKKAMDIEDQVSALTTELEELQEVKTSCQLNIEKIKAQLEDISSQIYEYSAVSSDNKDNVEELEEQVDQLAKTVKNINGKLSENKIINDKILSEIKIQIQDTATSIKEITQSIDICNSDLVQLSKCYKRITNEIAELQVKITEESEKKTTFKQITGDVVSTQVIIEPAIIINKNPEQYGLGEFSNNLSDAFKQCQISCDPNYITSIISSGFHPLFVGYSARETAIAVSISLTGETPTIVSLPPDYNNIAELENICCNVGSKAVLIEDGIGAMRDKMFYSIFRKLKTMNEKPYLFLLSESNEELELIPKSFYLHTTLIQCNDIDAYVNYDRIEPGSISDKMSNLIEHTSYYNNKRKIKRIFEDTDLPEMYLKVKQTIFKYYCPGTIENAVSKLIENEIKYISEDADSMLNKTGVKV